MSAGGKAYSSRVLRESFKKTYHARSKLPPTEVGLCQEWIFLVRKSKNLLLESSIVAKSEEQRQQLPDFLKTGRFS